MTKENLEELRERLIRDERVRQMIRVRAYEIYQMRGPHPGNQAEDWFQAEEEVLTFLIADDSRRAIDETSPESKVSVVTAEGQRERPAAKSSNPRRTSGSKRPASKTAASKRASSKKPANPKTTSKRPRKKPTPSSAD